LGVIMNTLGSTSSWYRNAIYFYLHFQYNGWFLVAIIGILFSFFEKYSVSISKKQFTLFYRLFISGVFLTFFLSVLWMKPNILFYMFSGLGGIFQLIAFGVLGKMALQNSKLLKSSLSKFEGDLLKMVGVLFIVKLLFQLIGAFPSIAEIISINIDFVIGYLHWIFLGVISISLFMFLKHFKLMKLSKTSYFIYLIAFFLTEGLLFYKGLVVWQGFTLAKNYYLLLFLVSAVFLVAIAGMLFLKKQNK